MSSWSPYKIRELLDHLTERDLRILTDIERFRLLTTNHIRRLEFLTGHATTSAGTRGTVRVLGRLEAGGYIARLSRRIGGPLRGSAATIWQLSATGERLQRARRGDAVRRRFQEPSPHYTRHTLAISELGVRLIEHTRDTDALLLALNPEPASWRSYPNALGALSWVRPDLEVVTGTAESETHAWVEVDLGTEHAPTILRRAAGFQRYFATGIEQATRDVFPLVVWVAPDERRRDQLRSVITGSPSLDPELFAFATNADVLEVLVPPDDAPADHQPLNERRNP